MNVHYRVSHGYACGVGHRWPSQTITSVRGRSRVTCGGCKRTRAYRLEAN